MTYFLKKMVLMCGAITVLWSGVAVGAGFQFGDAYLAKLLTGDMRVSCFNKLSHYTRCRRWTLYPVEYSYFEAPGVDADRVELVSSRADGKIVSKKGKFLASKGRSEKRFNLWISTLFQNPLLDIGDNLVKYTLKKAGKVVETGTVKITVSDQKEVQYCRDMTISSSQDSDCDFPSRLCSTYFNRLNYTCE